MMKLNLKYIAASALTALALASTATADDASERYVAENANAVLHTLNDPALDAESRTETFASYMDQFTDLDAVSNFVIGRYARTFTETELTEYRAAFRDYALAVYESELDRYRGESVEVTGSYDRTPRDSIVNTRIPREDGQAMDVRWRVLNRDGQYQVVDVALNIEGNLLWLAIEQRAQFLALLDRTNGSADALIAKIRDMTSDLESSREVDSAFDALDTAETASN